MAKKKTAPTDPEVVPGTIEVIEAEVVEIPQELEIIKQEYGLKLSDDKVDAHVLTYAPFFKELVDLESEMSELLIKEVTPDTMKEASALRKKYMKIRTGTNNQKLADKAGITAEGKFLDAIYNRIKEAAEQKEADCEAIETKLANIEAERIAALRAERIATLEQLDYDTEFLTVEDMSEESFNRLVKKATEAKQALELSEQQRAEAEELRRKNAEQRTTRINMLATIGLTFLESPAGNFYAGKDGDIKAEMIDAPSEDFQAAFSIVSNARDKRLQEEADALQAEKDAAAKLTSRINRVTSAGLKWDEATQMYSHGDYLIKLESLKLATDEQFDTVMSDTETKIKTEQEAAKKFEARLYKIESLGLVYDANSDKYEDDYFEAEAEALRDMSDKDFNEFIAEIETDQSARKEQAQRIANRIKGLTDLGFVEAEHGFNLNEDYISIEDINTWSVEQFSAVYLSFKKNVEAKRAQDAADLEEAKRLKAEKETEAEAKRVAALAPDKTKVGAFYKAFIALPFPEMATTEGKAAIERIKVLHEKMKAFIVEEGKKLA